MLAVLRGVGTGVADVLSRLPLLPGDILLARSDSRIGRWIRATETLQSGGAEVNHAGICLGSLTQIPSVIESLWRVTRTFLVRYDRVPVVVWRRRRLTETQRSEIALAAVSVEHDAYGVLKLPLFALDAIFGTYWFTRKFGFTSFKVCSNLVAWSFENAIPERDVFGRPWRSVTPDLIDDWCLEHPREWMQVYCTLPTRSPWTDN